MKLGKTVKSSEEILEKGHQFQDKDFIAKTKILANGRKVLGQTVLEHSEIVGLVASELINSLPKWLQEKLFPSAAKLIAAAHDVGKISPTFQEKIRRGTDEYVNNSMPGLKKANPELESGWGGHSGVGQAATRHIGAFVSEVIGRHHGGSPNHSHPATAPVFGGELWQSYREDFLKTLKKKFSVEWPVIGGDVQAALLSGLTTVADWVGSSIEDVDGELNNKVRQSLIGAGFVRPEIIRDLSFKDVFGSEFEIRDVQSSLINSVTEAGVYVMEAPMGVGKTEAALYAAYRALADGRATGLYFALPTQLTSDKIHTRVNQFLQAILDASCLHRKALLLHGSAWLRETEMGDECEPGKSWFNTSKRGILAPFAVGTIDQALMSVMNVKHGFVRAFGLAGKVVILDEVHTYDAYTGTLLDALVKMLRSIHCTVIILSATLTNNRRLAMLDSHQLVNKPPECYPLISALPNSKNPDDSMWIKTEPMHDIEVSVRFCRDNHSAIEEVLKRAELREQVLWIENTVADAQEIYRIIASRAAEIGVECGLLHSRFLKVDRENNENKWVNLFGKMGVSSRSNVGRVLVGTQVLEQSLDIDADFLVTRICPTDMLLQRIGRLWRHRENDENRPASASRATWILSPSLDQSLENPKRYLGKTARVYMRYVLCRTIEVWQGLDNKKLEIPKQIRPLLDATYDERDEHGLMARYKQEVLEARSRLGTLALQGISKCGKTLSENKASTRYSDQEMVDLLILSSVSHTKERTLVRFVNEGGTIEISRGHAKDKKKLRDLSSQLMSNTVKVPVYSAPEPPQRKDLDWIKNYIYLGDEDDALLRIVLIQDDGSLCGLNNQCALKGHHLSYNCVLGYVDHKIGKEETEQDDDY